MCLSVCLAGWLAGWPAGCVFCLFVAASFRKLQWQPSEYVQEGNTSVLKELAERKPEAKKQETEHER